LGRVSSVGVRTDGRTRLQLLGEALELCDRLTDLEDVVAVVGKAQVPATDGDIDGT
jgi:hypothetical protein